MACAARRVAAIFVTLGLWCLTAPSHATLLTYTITAPASARTAAYFYSNPISFTLDTDNLGPDASRNPLGWPGYVDVVSADYLPYQSSPLPLTSVYFQNYGEPSLGYDSVLWLYSGPIGSAPSSYVDVSDLLVTFNKQPSFATGDFYGFDQTSQLLDIRVRMANVSAVPEPSGWALLLIGFAAMGLCERRVRAARRSPT